MHLFKFMWCFALLGGCSCLNIISNTSNSAHAHSNDLDDIGAGLLLAEKDSSRKFFNFSLITKPTKKPTTTTPTPTTNATTATPAPTPAPCTCGTGGKPTALNVTRKRRSSIHFESIEDEGNVDALDDYPERGDNQKRVEDKSSDFRIVHGVASSANAWPWMVALIQGFNPNGTANLNQFCGGTLINANTVLTAGHCFQNFTSNSQILSQVTVLLGTNSILSNVTSRSVVRLSNVTIHPQFNSSTWDNDIALLKLALPVPLSSTIRPICLSQTGAPFNKRNVTVVGWGTGQSVQSSTYKGQKWLREAGMQTIPNARCTKLGETVTPGMICAIGLTPTNTSSPCFGDSGGPLMLYRPKSKTFSLIGVVSHGITPCGVKGPPVFTRVGSFLPFIMSSSTGTFCSNSFT